ncbi:MAG: site-specific integrase [Firmicutes bacterium]|nr:site-specific integrase [Bacillota bacterium]
MPRKLKNIEKKTGRRGNNEGSIYQRKDGRWCAQVTVGYRDNGKAIIKYAYGSSRQEVAKKLAKFTNEVFENGYTAFAPSDTKMFYPMLEDWFFTFKEPVIGSATSEKLRNFIKNHIKPEFGNLEVHQVDLFRLQRFFNGLSKKGICLQSIKHIKQLLNQFFEQYLMKQGLVKENPLESVKIRSNERDDNDRDNLALSPELRTVVLSKLEAEPVLKPILTVFMLTGMRPGELIALKWRDVDFEKSSISIRLAASREIEFDDDGNVKERRQIISNTKTVLSVRSFKTADNVMLCLQDWMDYLKQQEAKTGIDFTSADCYVFSTRKGEMRGYSGLRSMLGRFLVNNNLEGYGINLYTFRHTFATMLLEERENPKIVSELMGHSKVLTTLSIYSHVISKSVYESTAKTLDRAYQCLLPEKEKTDKPCTGSSALIPLQIDRSFDSNSLNFRQF